MGRSDGLLSWNMGCGAKAKFTSSQRKARLKLLEAIVAEKRPAIIALQEAPEESELNVTLGKVYSLFQTAIGISIAHDIARWVCDYKDISIPRVAVAGLSPIGASHGLWVFNLHCPALYVSDAQKTSFLLSSVMPVVTRQRSADEFRQEIICGDLNMSPFASPVVRPEGLHANRSLIWAQTKSSGLQKRMFNATWKVMANHVGACGTMYSSLDIDGPWHAVDQIILSAGLASAPAFAIEVVDGIPGYPSLRKNGSVGAPDPNIGSDHLPIFATLDVG